MKNEETETSSLRTVLLLFPTMSTVTSLLYFAIIISNYSEDPLAFHLLLNNVADSFLSFPLDPQTVMLIAYMFLKDKYNGCFRPGKKSKRRCIANGESSGPGLPIEDTMS